MFIRNHRIPNTTNTRSLYMWHTVKDTNTCEGEADLHEVVAGVCKHVVHMLAPRHAKDAEEDVVDFLSRKRGLRSGNCLATSLPLLANRNLMLFMATVRFPDVPVSR